MSINHKELLEKSPLAIAISDADERISWCNQALIENLQLDENDIIGKLYPSLPIEAIDKDAHIVQLFADNCKEDIKFHYWQNELSEPKGARIHYFAKERKTQKKFSLAAAKLDNGQLPKRASWVEFLNYEVSRSRRYNNPLSILKLHLLVFDRPVSVADETLHATIKDTLMDELRWADMIGHTDQGTYLLVLPETPVEALEALRVKLIAALERKITFISEDVHFRLVFGEASWERHDDSQSLLKRARESLVEKLETLLNQ